MNTDQTHVLASRTLKRPIVRSSERGAITACITIATLILVGLAHVPAGASDAPGPLPVAPRASTRPAERPVEMAILVDRPVTGVGAPGHSAGSVTSSMR